ncbi:hypothetical protein C8R48DRAFT_677789 [Suillus tomentosus]|nr:hypothetical protein C8R48DRAFT_677789 [Suillus tomentosus]
MYNTVQLDMCVIMGIMESIGNWGVIVYNQMASKLLAKENNDLAIHLSHNNVLPEYRETNEEVLLTVFNRINMAVHINFNLHGKFPSYYVIIQLLRNSEKGNKEATKQLATLCKLMKTCEENEKGNLSTSVEVIRRLNEHAETKSEEEINGNSILKNLDRIVACVTLHLTLELGAQHTPEPLLGACIMNYMWDYLIRTQNVMLISLKSFMMRLNNVMLNISPQLPPQPKDKGTFDEAIAKMGENEQVLYEALLKIVMKRKQRNVINLKNIAGEACTITGIIGLHITAWDWAIILE